MEEDSCPCISSNLDLEIQTQDTVFSLCGQPPGVCKHWQYSVHNKVRKTDNLWPLEGSHRDLEMKFYDFSMTFHDHFLRIPWLRKLIWKFTFVKKIVHVQPPPPQRSDREQNLVSQVSYFLHVEYLTAIAGLPVSLCVKSVGNQHIFLKSYAIDIYKNPKSHDFFFQIFIFHDFSRPRFYFFIFHDFPWPWEPCTILAVRQKKIMTT